jgi:hypothetical protein
MIELRDAEVRLEHLPSGSVVIGIRPAPGLKCVQVQLVATSDLHEFYTKLHEVIEKQIPIGADFT